MFSIEGTGVGAGGSCHAVVSPPHDLKMKAKAITKTIRATIPNKLPRELKILLPAAPPYSESFLPKKLASENKKPKVTPCQCKETFGSY
jgi:hypothetical protein